MLDYKVLRDLKGYKVLLVQLVYKVLPVLLVHKVLLAQKELLVRKVYRV